MIARARQLNSLYGRRAGSSVLLLEKLVPALDRTKYRFMPEVEWEAEAASDFPAAMRTYWLEILYRCHWGAATSLIRSQRWLAGVELGLARENLMVFAACLRGFLESAADTDDALNAVGTTLAEHFALVNAALMGRLRAGATFGGEGNLLAFTFATRKSGRPGTVYEAKNVTEYLKRLKDAGAHLDEVYAHLCDLAHPGAGSVLSYVRTTDGITVELAQVEEKLSLMILRQALPDTMRAGIALGVTNMFLLLKLLNFFDVAEIRTPLLDSVHPDSPAWAKIESYMRTSRVDSTLV